jgi:nicotinate-nucleotide adenylyltransferase
VRTALFGGSFNPIHIGHLIMAEEVLLATGCDRILFLPANIPPHKALDDPGPELRAAMVEASIGADPRFGLSRCELERSGISYTIDSLRILQFQGLVEKKPCIIIGDDLLDGFSSWKEADLLSREAELIVVRRTSPRKLLFAYPHRYLNNRILPISSTEIRTLIQEGGAWRYLVPEGARGVIEKNALYGYGRD